MSDIDTVLRNARAHEQQWLLQKRERLDAWGAGAEQYMKQNAPWQDETGEARDRLAYVPDHPADPRDGGRGHLVQGAPHGVFLELANASRFGIIPQTIAVLGPQLVADLAQ